MNDRSSPCGVRLLACLHACVRTWLSHVCPGEDQFWILKAPSCSLLLLRLLLWLPERWDKVVNDRKREPGSQEVIGIGWNQLGKGLERWQNKSRLGWQEVFQKGSLEVRACEQPWQEGIKGQQKAGRSDMTREKGDWWKGEEACCTKCLPPSWLWRSQCGCPAIQTHTHT